MRWWTRARLGVFQRWFCVSLDADDRQNDDGCGFSGIGATKAHQAPIVRKFDDVTHLPPSSDARDELFKPIR
jgi:hypothetical protein